MALREQPVAIQFAGGVETKTDFHSVPSTRLLDLSNAVFTKGASLSKRSGYSALSQTIEGGFGATVGVSVGLAERDGEILLFDGRRAYSRRAAVDSWSDTGEVCSTVVGHVPVARTGTAQTQPDQATNNGVTVVAWEDNRGGVWCSVLDASSLRIIVPDTQLDAAGISPRCVPCGDRLHVIWANAASRNVMVVVIDPLNPLNPFAPLALAGDLSPTNPVYDVVPTVLTSASWTGLAPCFLAWVTTSGLGFGYVHSSGVIGSSLTGLPNPQLLTAGVTTVGPIAVAYDRVNSHSVAILYDVVGSSIVAAFWSIDLTTNIANASLTGVATLWLRLTCEYEPTLGVLWWAAEQDHGRSDLNLVLCGSVRDDGTILIDGATRSLRGHCLVSRAFLDGSDVYCAVVHAVQFYNYVAVLRMSGASWGSRVITASRSLEGQSPGQLPRKHLPSVHAVAPDTLGMARRHTLALSYRIQLSSANGDQFGEVGIRVATLDFANENAYQTAQLGRGLYLPGGVMQHYDGARWAEAGFHAAPDGGTADGGLTYTGLTAADGGPGAGAIAPGTYGYRAIYEEIDNQGELHPGPTSVEVNVVVGGAGTNTVNLSIPTCRLTGKKNVRIGVFRSLVGEDAEFFRVSSLDPNATTGANRFLANDPTVDAVTFVDALADLVVQDREGLYTNGGILSNDPASCAGGAIAGGKSRLFWLDQADAHIVRYSQQLEDDMAMEPSASLSFRVDPYGGNLVAIGIMDDAVIALAQTAIYGCVGPGPDADGGASNPQNIFTPAQLITSDVGCLSPRSIVQTPIGIMFDSQKGIMLLGRDRQVQSEVAEAVYAYKGQGVSRATLLPDRHQVVFLTAATDGRSLLYDYERQQWSTYTNHVGVDAIVSGDVYYYLRPDGRVFEETPGLYADDNMHIPMRIETAWIKFLPYLQGWQSVLWAYFIGTYKSAHVLNVRFRIDYQDAWSPAFPLDVNSNYNPALYGAGSYGVGQYGGAGGASGTVYQRRLHLNQKSQSIQFRIEDSEDTATFGAAFELSELLLIGGVLGIKFQPGAARSG